jgi:hypothetical protein
MAIAIFGKTLIGGEAQRKAEAANEFASKYPLSQDINEVRQNIGKATIELSTLKNSKPSTSGGKRIKTRNITALSSWINTMQNTIKDMQSGVGSIDSGLAIAPPTADSLLGKTPYSVLPKYGNQDLGIKIPTPSGILKTPLYTPPSQEASVGSNVVTNDTTMGAKGDYPPPQGVQGDNTMKYIGLGALGLGVIALIYFLAKSKSK